ncbi:MAG: glycosyl hydrolase [Bacteroidales bacterium]|nr:glycosyl hydrolase [Bacteroidales bacterium]
MNIRFLSICFSGLLFISGCQSPKTTNPVPDKAELQKGFATPPAEARPKALWAWVNGNFEIEEITREMEEAKRQGMGGFDIWDINPVVDEAQAVPKGEPFMSNAYTKAIVHAIKEATRLDLELGLTIASGWNAGGAWTKPEYATMALYHSSLPVEGGKNILVDLPFPETPQGDYYFIEHDASGKPTFYKEAGVFAIPATQDSVIPIKQVIDLSEKTDGNGKLEWDAPAGEWVIYRLICANTGQPMYASSEVSKGPMIDHFNPEATTVHLQYFIDKLLKEIGSFDGTNFRYFYTDSYEVKGKLWTPKMKEEFKRRKGYDISPYLPILYGFEVENKNISDRFKYDYAQVLSDMIIDAHYANAERIAEENGIQFCAEAAGPGAPVFPGHNCPFESLRSTGVLGIPRGEFWHGAGEHDPVQVIKGVASASHIYNKKYVEAEAFTSTKIWQESFNDLKPTADRAFCEGLNRIVFHTFPHTPKSAGKPGYIYSFGTQISEELPWWDLSRAFMEYLGRCSYLLQQGNFHADLLTYYGDQAPNFMYPKHIREELGFGYDYEGVNSDIILNKLSVKNGMLVLPHGQEFAVLELPNQESMNLDVLKKIEQLVHDGATVIGPKPLYSTGLKDYEKNDREVQKIADRLWDNGKIISNRPAREVLMEKGIVPSFDFKGDFSIDSIDFIQRRIGNTDLYFVTNKSDSPISMEGLFRVHNKSAELWNPETGMTERAVAMPNDDKTTSVWLNLGAKETVFVLFFDENDGQGIQEIAKNNQRIFPNGNVLTSYAPLKVRNNDILFYEPGNYKFKAGEKDFTATVNENPAVFPINNIWDVSFEKGLGAPESPVQWDKLTDWTKSEDFNIRYFSGIATYTTNFQLPEDIDLRKQKVFLSLGDVKNVARVHLNGKELQTDWTFPFVIELPGELINGDNQLIIEVANLMPNRMIGDFKIPEKERITHSNIRRMPNGWSIPLEELPSKEYELLPSGLIGPVELISVPFITY